MLNPKVMMTAGAAVLAAGALALFVPPFVGAAPICPAQRFTVNNGWALDATTKLSWQQNFVSDQNWDKATSLCAALGGGSRLPSAKELLTIVDETKSSPALDLSVFPGTPAESSFWTSSVSVGSPSFMWTVLFNFGQVSSGHVQNGHVVRCVR